MRTVVNIILDKSASMNTVQDATINSINEYLDSLRTDKNDYSISLTLFDTKVSRLYVNEPLENVEPLSRKTYSPDWMTALHDAVGMTLKDIERDVAKGTKSLVVIMTDGEENSSREYRLEDVKNRIDQLTAKGNWKFAFMGATIDSYHEAARFGIARGNTVNFVRTSSGVASASKGLYQATSGYATMDVATASTSDFFSQKTRDQIENAE
jgi:hypothetical protein